MARRRPRQLRRHRVRGFFLFLVLAILLAGFLTRRLMMPTATHYMTYRTQSEPQNSADQNQSAPDTGQPSRPSVPAEHLTDSDRRALDEVIKHKTGGQ